MDLEGKGVSSHLPGAEACKSEMQGMDLEGGGVGCHPPWVEDSYMILQK